MKIQQLIRDLEDMQAEGMTEVLILTYDSQRLFPHSEKLDHVTVLRPEKAALSSPSLLHRPTSDKMSR